MPIEIRTTGFDEFLDSGQANIKALIMGDHGCGKTPSAATWPKPIFADCEDGMMSLASKSVPYARIRSSDDMEALIAHLRRDAARGNEKREYKTLVIDTLDRYQKTLIQERLRKERKESFSGFGDWGWLESKMNILVDAILGLNMNVVVNLHTKISGGSEDEPSIEIPRLKGDVKDAIFEVFDFIGRMEKSFEAVKGQRVEKRQIRWHSEVRFPNLRDRSGKLPRFTEVDFENDFQRIFDAIAPVMDELPESKVVETLEVEGDGEVNENLEGGPVETVTTPKPPQKRAAKKTAAKKTAAKKAAPAPEPEPEVRQEETPAPEAATDVPAQTEAPAEDPWQPPLDHEKEAVKNVLDGLGGEVVQDEVPVKAQAPAPKASRVCGDQPDAMVKKGTEPLHKGCGKPLNEETAGEAKFSMLKAKAYLCNECWSEFLAN